VDDEYVFDARHVIPVCSGCGGTTGCAHCGGTGTDGHARDEDPDVLTYLQWLRDSSSIGPER